jgi:hypothetical protein
MCAFYTTIIMKIGIGRVRVQKSTRGLKKEKAYQKAAKK